MVDILTTRSEQSETNHGGRDIELHLDNKNREKDFFLSKLWKHLLQTLEK
jgi:hypothetical protein